jgi:hypothetical protein
MFALAKEGRLLRPRHEAVKGGLPGPLNDAAGEDAGGRKGVGATWPCSTSSGQLAIAAPPA